MVDKADRVFNFTALAVLNLVIIWFTLTLASTAPVWVSYLLILVSLVADALILGWSLNSLPNYGATGEDTVVGIWSGWQLLQLLLLTIITGMAALGVGVIVFVLSILWMRLRIVTMNKVMDLRYW